MARPLQQLKQLHLLLKGIPVICAGDIFDDGWRPNRCPPELINFAIEHLPPMYAIPGQHDLPHHRYEDVEKSAYWTLVQAGKITDIGWDVEHPQVRNSLIMYGFPWGREIAPIHNDDKRYFHLAVIHRYIWSEGKNRFNNAPEDNHIGKLNESLQGYDAAVFGDNHIPFTACRGRVWNCGSMMARDITQRHYQPSFGLLYSDGHIKVTPVDISKDKWLESDKGDIQSTIMHADFGFIIDQMKQHGAGPDEFENGIRNYLSLYNISKDVQDIVITNLQ